MITEKSIKVSYLFSKMEQKVKLREIKELN